MGGGRGARGSGKGRDSECARMPKLRSFETTTARRSGGEAVSMQRPPGPNCGRPPNPCAVRRATHPLLVAAEVEPAPPPPLLLLPLRRLLALAVALLPLAPLLLEALLLHAPLLEFGGLHGAVVHDVERVLLGGRAGLGGLGGLGTTRGRGPASWPGAAP